MKKKKKKYIINFVKNNKTEECCGWTKKNILRDKEDDYKTQNILLFTNNYTYMTTSNIQTTSYFCI